MLKNINLKASADQLKEKTKATNKEFMRVSNDVVEEGLAIGNQWADVFAEALKVGTTFVGSQQDLALRAVAGMKDHVLEGGKRTAQLFGLGNLNMVEQATEFVDTAKQTVETTTAKFFNKAEAAKQTADAVVENVADAVTDAFEKDDLKLINSIGPKMEEVLNKAGIVRFEQLATAKEEQLNAILAAANPRYVMFDVATWIEEAKHLTVK